VLSISYLAKRNTIKSLLQFFSVFSAFALAFWYGTKAVAEGRIDNVGTIVM
jgi:hypothetical protein